MHIKKDDIVQIVSGNDRGKQGRVLKVFPEDNRIIVEGVNFIKRHTRPNQKLPQGGIVEREGPIHSSNAMVVCPKCNQLTTTGMKPVVDEAKNKSSRVRYCKKCGEMIVIKSS
jgi:large subunit ribosomal protein L24